ncbi:uncharacterized protein LOC122397188 [Colletes gigas]|uniref:uncharacterized protein LOC122397188 n=1 Tax=Colletes gigas TaxID=935657 RepID=UPI001C9B11EE|nr:uncharacterized protein LOC122397188 [Colletes gigas]
METLESSRVCRLCGKQSGISINIFDKNENHVKKINAILPIMVHEMDLLPKHMCYRCSYKLEEFHKFYVDCLKTDAGLKSQLSWMRKGNPKERVGIPMVHIENIKLEPPDYGAYDATPMVDNANYMNSMSSVTFQPNDIPYAAYTQCRRCCDKMDQSNQTVATNYESTVPRCNRLNDVGTETDGSANESRAVKENALVGKTFQERSNPATRVDENVKNSRWCRPTSSSFDHVHNTKCKSIAREEVNVRNLRPRNGLVDYVGTRKKMAPKLQIKTENPDDFEGHVLRPRKKMIDYCDRTTQRRNSEYKKNRISRGGKYNSKGRVQNIVNNFKVSSKKKVRFAVKQEQHSDLEDMVFDKLSVTLPKNYKTRSIGNLADNIDALPNDLLFNVQSDRNCLLTCEEHDVDFSVANNLKSLSNAAKNNLKSGKIDLDRIATISYAPKYLRSKDFFLRNGKVKKVRTTNLSTKKLRRDLRSITGAAKTNSRTLMETIGGIVNTKKISASIKLIDNNLKHFCEECNLSFINRELFKLHTCYH